MTTAIRIVLSVPLVVALVSCSAQAPRSDGSGGPPPTADRSRVAAPAQAATLQGRWRVVKVERNGKPDTDLSDEWEFGESVRALFAGGELWRGTYSTRPGAEPHELDIEIAETNELLAAVKGTARGVYRVTGDALRLCVRFAAQPSSPRPASLDSVQGDQHVCFDMGRLQNPLKP